MIKRGAHMNRRERRDMVKRLQKTGMKRDEAIKIVDDLHGKEKLREQNEAIFSEGQRCQVNYDFVVNNDSIPEDYKAWAEQNKDRMLLITKTRQEARGKEVQFAEDVLDQWHSIEYFIPVTVATIKMEDGTTRTINLGGGITDVNDPRIQSALANALNNEKENDNGKGEI